MIPTQNGCEIAKKKYINKLLHLGYIFLSMNWQTNFIKWYVISYNSFTSRYVWFKYCLSLSFILVDIKLGQIELCCHACCNFRIAEYNSKMKATSIFLLTSDISFMFNQTWRLIPIFLHFYCNRKHTKMKLRSKVLSILFSA